jgi:hypothetical protein
MAALFSHSLEAVLFLFCTVAVAEYGERSEYLLKEV